MCYNLVLINLRIVDYTYVDYKYRLADYAYKYGISHMCVALICTLYLYEGMVD